MYKLSNIDALKKGIAIGLIIMTIIELVVFPAMENLYGCLVSIFAWWLICNFVLTQENLIKALLPTFAVLGYVICYFVTPLLVTFVEAKPLTFNFQVPYLMFYNQMLNVITIVGAFCLCVCSYSPNNFIHKLWLRIGYFDKPSASSIWILGFMGLASLLLNIGDQANDVEYTATSSVVEQILDIVRSFAVFPLCLLFPQFCGISQSYEKKKYVWGYLVLVAIIGISTTRRALVFNAFASVLVLYFLCFLFSQRFSFKFRHGVIGIVLFFLITGPLTDLAAAMILYRHDISTGTITFTNIINLYKDKEELHSLYEVLLSENDNGGNNALGWSEYYVDNIFLDRFCNIRVQDATLYYAEQLGYANRTMTEYFYDNFINHIPSFIVELFGEEKKPITTPVDHMLNTYLPHQYGYWGGWKVGGDTGIGLATMGYAYYPFAFIVYFFTFYFLCTCTNINGKMVYIPLPILSTMMWYFTYYDNAFGIYRSINLLLSKGWRDIFVYCVFMFVFNRFIIRKILYKTSINNKNE